MRGDMGTINSSIMRFAKLMGVLDARWCCYCCLHCLGCCATPIAVRTNNYPLPLFIDEFRRINLVVTTPLTENMPGPSATKPGDVYGLFLHSLLDANPCQRLRHEWQVGRSRQH